MARSAINAALILPENLQIHRQRAPNLQFRTEKAEKFLGVSLVAEKEMVLIVTRQEKKNEIMRSIMDHAGLGTKARAVVFSLPVTDIAGMYLMNEMLEEA